MVMRRSAVRGTAAAGQWALLTLALLGSAASASSSAGAQRLENWRTENALARQVDDGLELQRLQGAGRIFLTSSPQLDLSGNVVEVTLSSPDSRAAVRCWVKFAGRDGRPESVEQLEQPLKSGPGAHRYRFDFAAAVAREGPISSVTFCFVNALHVEVHDAQVRARAPSDVFISPGLQATDVNFLLPFELFALPLNLWAALLVGAAALAALAPRRLGRKELRVQFLGAAILATAGTLDFREGWQSAAIASDVWVDWVQPAADQKRAAFLDDVPALARFVKRQVAPGSPAITYFGQHDYFLALKYHLSGLGLVEGGEGEALGPDGLAPVTLFDGVNGVSFDGQRLRRGDQVLAEGGRVLAFNPRAFLYWKQ